MCKKNNWKKIAAILLSFCILLVMLHFIAFEAANEIHDCTGADCPICHELQLAQQMTKQFAAVMITAAVSFFFAVSIKCIETVSVVPFQERTLIIDKVRLDN